jgi:hypothetical protein
MNFFRRLYQQLKFYRALMKRRKEHDDDPYIYK